MPAQRKRFWRPSGWATTRRGSPSIISRPATASCRTASPTWPISRPRPAASTSAPRSSPCRSTIRSAWSRTPRSSTSCRTAACGSGVGSGYRPYEFEGLGKDFENRRDMVEEAIGLMFDAWHRHRWDHKGKYFAGTVQGRVRDAAASRADAASAALHGGRHRPLDRLQRPQRLRAHALDPARRRDAGGADRALQARARQGERRAAAEPGGGQHRHRALGLYRRHRCPGARRHRGGDRQAHRAFRRHGHQRLSRLGVGEGQRRSTTTTCSPRRCCTARPRR